MSGKGTMKNFTEMLAEAKLPERTVEICLRADLVAEHEEAERDLEQAEKSTSTSLAGNGTGALIERIDALEAEMREASYTFVLRAAKRPAWRALIAGHPPRKGDDGETNKADAQWGFNLDTFYPAIVRACLVDPELTDAEFEVLLDEKLTDSQFSELATAAFNLNAGAIDIPFSLAASRMKRATSGE
jgi:hypothetical protein